MTLATDNYSFDWKSAANGWQISKVQVEDHELVVVKKGRCVGVLIPGLSDYCGINRNRIQTPTYRKKIGDRISTVPIGFGTGIGTYRRGEAQAIFASNLKEVLKGANVRLEPGRYAALTTMLSQATQVSQHSAWVTGELAAKDWQSILREVREERPLTHALLSQYVRMSAYNRENYAVNLHTPAWCIAHLTGQRMDALREAFEEVLRFTPDFKLFAGTPGVGALSDVSNIEDERKEKLPFEEGNVEPTEAELEQAVADASERDLLNAMGALVAGMDQRLENLCDDLAGIEKRLNTYAMLGARRNMMLARIMKMLGDVLATNLCSPDEHPQGRWKGGDVDA